MPYDDAGPDRRLVAKLITGGAVAVRTTRREWQKAAVRAELRTVAIEVFLAQGYHEANIAEIAERAGVSERTFYRYFPTKESVALDWIDETAPAVHEMLRRQRPTVSPSDALCEAFIAATPPSMDGTLEKPVLSLIFSTPRLLSAYYDHARTWEKDVAQVLAERLGTDVASDPRPALWSAMGFAIAHTVARERATQGNTDFSIFPTLLRKRFAEAAQFFHDLSVPG
ncbi:hypothetical protein C5613_24760 [Rhodococcus opacus]|uniref:HTH tetR-type domain-containing protein n=1 Tax=Rhodococcus opacus TaxID=37919 RepID=A0A2S8J4Q8_RHOOP|nr:hypothetical protein C5613_24760 [Rhodococcus opacus]